MTNIDSDRGRQSLIFSEMTGLSAINSKLNRKDEMTLFSAINIEII